MGAEPSIYWGFSVDLVTGGGTGDDAGSVILMGRTPSPECFGQAFWTLVGIAGVAAAAAGGLVRRLGLRRTRALGLAGLAVAIGLPAAVPSPRAAVVSGLLFGASFVLLAACFGLWSLRAAGGSAVAASSLTFLLMSPGPSSWAC